jgi:hypothetical protein
MNYLEQGTANLIERMGDLISILTSYRLTSAVSPGDILINVDDSWGIQPESVFMLGDEQIVVDEVEGTTLYLSDPIALEHSSGDFITSSIETFSIPVPRFKRITYELLEFIRKVRVAKNTVLNYGSLVTHFSEEFFIVGVDPGDASYSISLREINANLTVKRAERKTTTGSSWSDTAIEPSTIYEGVKAYFQYNLADLPFRQGLGYVQTGSSLAIISRTYNIKIGDKILDSMDSYKVVGFNRYTSKNLLTLILNVDPSK